MILTDDQPGSSEGVDKARMLLSRWRAGAQ